MKIEEAIEWMEEAVQETTECFEECSPALQKELVEQKEIFELAITALRSMPEAGEPLTVEKLKQMDGKPVWVEFIGHPDGTPIEPLWMLVNCRERKLVTDVKCVDWIFEGWFAYSYPPAHIDRSKWEECELCSLPDGKSASRLILAETCNGEAKYCPYCGRPLTEEAWAELERRVRG